MLNIFKKGYKTLTSDVETWVVRWNRCYGLAFSHSYEEMAQFFTDEEESKEFAESLKKSIKLLGNTYDKLTWVKCERVKNNGL